MKFCATLKHNHPSWNVVEGDVSKINFSKYQGEIDVLSGGFPCQAFSYAGKKLGFKDIRGTLFFEFARSIQECSPRIFIAENVKGLMSHDQGRTFTVSTIFLYRKVVSVRILARLFHSVLYFK